MFRIVCTLSAIISTSLAVKVVKDAPDDVNLPTINKDEEVDDTISIIEQLDYKTIMADHGKPVCRTVKVCVKDDAGCSHKKVCIGSSRMAALKTWCMENVDECKDPQH